MKNYKLGVIPSPYDERDYKAEAIYPKIVLPNVLDYRGECMTIRDQGNQGSCAAMAGATMKEWQEFKESTIKEYYSPQFIYNNRENASEGMYMRDLMKILSDLGDCQERYCEYGDLGKPSETAYVVAINFLIKDYA